jgi:hypothetical protein
MKITVEFDSMEEYEAFRISGKKTRSKKEEAEEAAPIEQTAQAIRDAQPLQAFTPPPASTGFPGANGGTPPVHPLVTAILARIDGAVSSGQPSDAVVTWFRQQIGPEAAQATLDQIKQIFIPRMTEAQLKQIAPQLGIQG